MSKPRVKIYPVLKWVGGKREIEDIIQSADSLDDQNP